MSDSDANEEPLEDSLIPPALIEYIPEEKRDALQKPATPPELPDSADDSES